VAAAGLERRAAAPYAGRMIRLALSFALAATPALASPAADFQALLADHWKATLARSPTFATSLGVRDYDTKLEDLSLAAQDAATRDAEAFRKRLAAIPLGELSPQDQVSARILDRSLEAQIEGNAYPARAMLFTNREGFHTGFATLPERMPFFTKADYESYVARLEAFPAQMDQAIATTKVAVSSGYALPCIVLDGFADGVRKVAEPASQSRFLRPFATRPATIGAADWEALKARATRAVEGGINPAYLRFADYLASDYLPKCRKEPGISAAPGGAGYYAWRVKDETTTDLSPDAIHRLGLSEVARIRAEMETVAKRAGFPSREAYVAHLRTDPRYYAKTPLELMQAASYWAKVADLWMPRLFGKLPRLPYGLKEIPAETAPYTTTAYYNSGAPAAGRAGVYFVNTSKLNERPLFELPALTIHEAVPGHHHQIALQQELDLPEFRRHAAFFTAFTEGWGLYSERLGIEMGAYEAPENDMGRLSYEMWRAARLVVDTGIHSKGWTKQQAVDFMLDNTALSAANIDAEVNRYIAWPGQALAYKLGELKIRELRALAEKELGPRFDLRAFHDTVLENGSIPLDVLDAHVRAWIAAQASG
jgi:uncharacterized protein (DUF885 family)